MDRTVWTCDLGRVEYVATAQLQRELRAAREVRAIPDTLLVLEHDPVITAGYRTEADEIAYARTLPLPVVETERGGKATYHGPGQVVIYPIFDLREHGQDVKRLVCLLENAIIETLDSYGIEAGRVDGEPGVWVDGGARKIASLGLRVTHWVSFHGIALNVENDLTPFTWFTPCGIAGLQTTSVAEELARTQAGTTMPGTAEVAKRLTAAIATQFGLTTQAVTREQLVAAVPPLTPEQVAVHTKRASDPQEVVA